ncbi:MULTISPECIES: SDR family NAD(P)-dependent oxidoreductase [Xanthobacter]|uniref:SDR family NAD(P)-dependent oxidoreductase n=1 Tax=Xanthobacter TaxID=279 RepID=UPI0037287BC7
MTEKKPRVVITGAASGIGAACATRLVHDGWAPILIDINAARLQGIGQRLNAETHVLDVTDEQSTETLAEELWAKGAIEGFVASAGIVQSPLPPHQLSMAEWDRVVSVDLRGLYLGCRAFGTRMAYAGKGAIVTISSCAGLGSTPLHAYGPVKAAVISLTSTLAAEWGRSGVRVNGVAPAFTLTELVRERAGNGERNLELFKQSHLIGRMIEPEEIAAPVAFLLSSEASAITGTTLPVDGGILSTEGWPSYGGLRPAYAPEA